MHTKMGCIFILGLQPLAELKSLYSIPNIPLLMKKVSLLVLVLVAGTISLFAQNKPESGFGFVVGVEGINDLGFNNGGGTLGFRYRLASGITARFNANLSTMNNVVTEGDIPSAGFTTTTTDKGTNFGIGLGAHYSFVGTDNLNPYIGADLGFSTVGGGSTLVRNELVDATEAGFGTNGDYIEVETMHAKGSRISFTPLVGFEYFFVPKLAIGGEFGWGFATTSTKGGEVTTTTQVNGGTTNGTVTVQLDEENKSSGFGTHGTGRVILSVYF